MTLWISLKTASVATALAGGFGILGALLLFQFEGRIAARWVAVFEALIMAPMILPPTVVGFLLLLVFGLQSPVGRLWERLWGDPLVFSWPATVVAASIVAMPLVYRSVRSALQQIDTELIHTARTFTDSSFAICRLILLPEAWPGLIGGLLLAFVRSLGEFGATLMLAGSIPGRTRTIPMSIYLAVERGDYVEAAQWTSLILLFSLSLIYAAEWGLRRHKSRGPFIASASVGELGSPQPTTDGLSLKFLINLASFPLKIELQTSGRRIAILGPSGSGKSMFLRCLAGLERLHEGFTQVDSILWCDTQKGIQVTPHQRKVGLLSQHFTLFPKLTVKENVGFALWSGERDQIMSWLQRMGLAELGDRRPTELSGGQQQRVALARALAAEPDLLLLDEPFSALDPPLRAQLEKLLKRELETYSGRLLLVTHVWEEAWRLCDEFLVIEQGQVIRHGTKEAVYAHPETKTVAELTGCHNFSLARDLGAGKIWLTDWNVGLEGCSAVMGYPLKWVGIRSHHIMLSLSRPTASQNVLEVMLVRAERGAAELTLYLKCAEDKSGDRYYHFETTVPLARGADFLEATAPFYAHLPPEHLLFLRS